MASSIEYEFFMSQIKHISDIKENDKTKLSKVFYMGSLCILRICKNRDLSAVYKALKEIKHRAISVIYDCVFANGNTYVIEEYIDGNTIEEKLDKEGVFSEKDVAKIMVEICDGLSELHRNNPPIVHNDINTSNIMLRNDGSVKLFDFDISRTYKTDRNQNTTLFGTADYASPEHFGYGQSEPRTDIYSLGVTMHKMLTGEILSNEHKITYRGKFKKIIKKCIEIDPKNRYTSVRALEKDLKKFLNRRKRFLYEFLGAIVFLLIISLFFEDSPNETQSDNRTNTESTISVEASSIETTSEIDNSTVASSDTISISEQKSSVPANSNVPAEKKMQNKYVLSGELKSMVILNDGTLVYLELISGEYHLKTSLGEDCLLNKDCIGKYSNDLIYDDYSNLLYLITSDYSSAYEIYSFDEKFNTKQVAVLFSSSRTIYGTSYSDPYASFFSDGTMYCDVLDNQFIDSKGWSEISSINYSVFSIINDKMYQLREDEDSGNMVLEEIDFQNKPIKKYEFPFDASFGRWRGIMYNNNKCMFFEATIDNKDYIYRFDGEKFEEIVCLNDYKYYTTFPYGEWCINENVLFMYDRDSKVIKEFNLK